MAISILPIRRNLKFNLNPAKALTWHRDGLNVSQFMNTMSLFFPVGNAFSSTAYAITVTRSRIPS